MRLHIATTSPYSRKVLVCAHVLGAMDQVTCIAASTSVVRRDPAVASLNPLGKIPVAASGELVLYDSRVVCEYLDARWGPRLFPREGRARWVALTQQALGDGLLDAALLIRYECTLRPGEKQWAPWTAGQWDKVRGALASIERQAGSLRCAGFSIGEVSLACALAYLDFRFPEFEWSQGHPHAAAWFARFCRLPAMAATQPAP